MSKNLSPYFLRILKQKIEFNLLKIRTLRVFFQALSSICNTNNYAEIKSPVKIIRTDFLWKTI